MRVPVEFPHSAGLEGYERGGDVACGGEGGGVDDFEGAGRGDGQGGLLRPVVGVLGVGLGVVGAGGAGGVLGGDVERGWGAGEDVAGLRGSVSAGLGF